MVILDSKSSVAKGENVYGEVGLLSYFERRVEEPELFVKQSLVLFRCASRDLHMNSFPFLLSGLFGLFGLAFFLILFPYLARRPSLMYER
jgi:hypothetical protein